MTMVMLSDWNDVKHDKALRWMATMPVTSPKSQYNDTAHDVMEHSLEPAPGANACEAPLLHRAS